jgi:hypothetical protein
MGAFISGHGVELSRRGLRLVVVQRFHVRAAIEAGSVSALDAVRGVWEVERGLSSSRHDPVLVQMYHQLLGGSLRPHQPDYTIRMREAVLDALSRGTLVVLEAKTRRVVMLVERPGAPPVLGPAEPTSWIEVELRDDSGAPFADEPYEIVTSDGRLRSGTLDMNGHAREEGIDPGNCKVTFPRINVWRAA